MKTQLGKLQKVKLGDGGYDDAMFGVSFTIGGDGWGVQDFWGMWQARSSSAQYTQEKFEQSHADTYTKIRELMKSAKVRDFNDLVGIPVECTFDNGLLKGWRVLTEVL